MWQVAHAFLLEPAMLISYNDLSAAWEALIYARGARKFLREAPLNSVDRAALPTAA